MQHLSLPPHSVSLYRSLEDFPIEQFLRFQMYWEQPLLAPNPDTEDAAAWSGQAAAAPAYPTELELLLRAYGSAPLPAVALTPHHLAFTTCVAALDGKSLPELPSAAAADLLALLCSYGLSEDRIASELTATRQATLAELTQLSPAYFAHLEDETFAYTQRQRRLLQECAEELANLRTLSVTPASIRSTQQLQDYLLNLLQPAPWGEEFWRMAQPLRQQTFATLCALLRAAGTAHPEQLAVAPFVRALEALVTPG